MRKLALVLFLALLPFTPKSNASECYNFLVEVSPSLPHKTGILSRDLTKVISENCTELMIDYPLYITEGDDVSALLQLGDRLDFYNLEFLVENVSRPVPGFENIKHLKKLSVYKSNYNQLGFVALEAVESLKIVNLVNDHLALNKIRKINSLSLFDSKNLTKIFADNLRILNSLEINGNPELVDIGHWLSKIKMISQSDADEMQLNYVRGLPYVSKQDKFESLKIKNSPKLRHLTGLGQLEYLMNLQFIETGLQSLADLKNLKEVYESFIVENNKKLSFSDLKLLALGATIHVNKNGGDLSHFSDVLFKGDSTRSGHLNLSGRWQDSVVECQIERNQLILDPLSIKTFCFDFINPVPAFLATVTLIKSEDGGVFSQKNLYFVEQLAINEELKDFFNQAIDRGSSDHFSICFKGDLKSAIVLFWDSINPGSNGMNIPADIEIDETNESYKVSIANADRYRIDPWWDIVIHRCDD